VSRDYTRCHGGVTEAGRCCTRSTTHEDRKAAATSIIQRFVKWYVIAKRRIKQMGAQARAMRGGSTAAFPGGAGGAGASVRQRR
jgi:hypothetical protein